MRCEDFLPWLESGGAQAAEALRHAEECASCRAAAEMLEHVKTELAGGERMPAAMRAAMLGIADDESSRGSSGMERKIAVLPPVVRPTRRPLWFAAIAASIVGLAFGVWWPLHKNDEVVRPRDSQPSKSIQTADVRRVGPITVETLDPRRELAALAGELAALEQTLVDAKTGAERLAVEQALERVLTDYQGTFAVRE